MPNTTRHPLAQLLRGLGAQLLTHTAQPHDELLSLMWGPRFDREHALALAARHPQDAAHAIPALLQAADTFDQLHASAQQRLRHMVVRHRRLGRDGTMPHHAPHPAH